MFNGFAMLVSAFVSYLTKDSVLNEMTLVSLSVIFFGWLLMTISKKNDRKINKRDAYFIVVLGWLTMVLSGMLPYIVTGSISSFSNIFFETMSGYTTTGSTIINDIFYSWCSCCLMLKQLLSFATAMVFKQKKYS